MDRKTSAAKYLVCNGSKDFSHSFNYINKLIATSVSLTRKKKKKERENREILTISQNNKHFITILITSD